MTQKLTWPIVETTLRGRPGWKRRGQQLEGPCPSCGGRNRAHLQHGGQVEILGSCRRCGATGIEIVRLLLGEPATSSPARAGRPRRDSLLSQKARKGGSERPGRVWATAGVVHGSPGAVYLAGRCVWPGGEHPAVRWLPADRAKGCRLYPRLPPDAAGCLAYRFAAPGEMNTCAVQVEAVNAAGVRLARWWYWNREDGAWAARATKRPSVGGSDFGGGRRVFEARRRQRELWVVEGPIDALAIARLAAAGVVGVPGTSGFKLAAVDGVDGAVVIAADGDAAGAAAAVRLAAALEAVGHPWRIVRPAAGASDWGDAAELAVEREALHDG